MLSQGVSVTHVVVRHTDKDNIMLRQTNNSPLALTTCYSLSLNGIVSS